MQQNKIINISIILMNILTTQQQEQKLKSDPRKFIINLAAENFFLKYISVAIKLNNIKIIMLKTPLTLGLLFILACNVGVEASPCPYSNHPGSVHSNQIIAALNTGSIPLNEAVESQCYNYSLPFEFQEVPQVAIAVHDFESQHSNTIFFYIKTIETESTSIVPFVVKTYWSYTRWTQITFSFIAEDRQDLQSGYYQIDSGQLSGCENGKQVQILLPFRNYVRNKLGSDVRHKQFNNKLIRHFLFLHGFEITTVPYAQNSRSPFQILIANSSVNTTGIAIRLSVTSTTQVDSVYISFIAYQQTTLTIIDGSYIFDRNTSSNLAHIPEVSIPRSFARIYGLRSFILNYSTNTLAFQTRWDGFFFSYSFQQSTTLVQYLYTSYVFFTGSLCQDCLGYPIESNGTCTNVCPPGTIRTPDNLCKDCGRGKIWDGKECIIECLSGQYLNPATNQCECPPSLNWNGETCISCTAGKIFNKQTLSCECPLPLRWNGFACAQIKDCQNGQVWDVYSFQCICPETTRWNGTFCATITPCTGGQVHNMNYICQCLPNYYWNGSYCTFSPCIGGQVWQGTKCVCPAGKNFNQKMCVECINGQVWNQIQRKCVCEDGYKWNSQYCEKTYDCTGNRIWNSTYNQCICRDSYYWSGYACLPIPTCKGGQYWNSVLMKCVCSTTSQFNGTQCIVCSNGQIWDTAILKCVCPPGTKTLFGKCQLQQQCSGGKIFNHNIWKCQCPEGTQWNGDYCISNICTDGRQYNSTLMSCTCPENKVFSNGRCIPPQISCNNGRVWNPAIYACECPSGTFPNNNRCDPIPICKNGMTYNPLTNTCSCPYGLVMKNAQCVNANCSQGQYWNGYSCEIISCPPPSYFYENRCVYGGPNQCTYGYNWNGITCVLYPPTCPLGTNWRNSICESSACPNGYYLDSKGQCNPLSSQCIPPANWVNQKCQISGGQCPDKTYLSNGKCQPYVPCANGHVWDFTYLRCICPVGSISNGVSCVECSSGKSWDSTEGCICPEGSFDTGISCESLTQNRCSGVANTIWENQKCKCRPGFTKIGFQCVCYGTQIGNFCDKCSYKPNSEWISSSNICKCLDGYTQVRGNCIKNSLPIGSNDPSQCNVGTYFDSNQKMCLPCPDGCLSCFDCYTCRSCRPQFNYNPVNNLCTELCGDGKRFVFECDDGNNRDGDGCSRDCKVETGYQCTGGSPDNKDSCYIFRPDKITLQRTGEIRKSTSIVLNIKLNYLPSSLLFSGDCANNCNQILNAKIVNGDRSAISITSSFVVGTKYSFIVTVDFGRSYIGDFTINIGINGDLIPKYFGAIPADTLEFQVKPSYLAAISEDNERLS